MNTEEYNKNGTLTSYALGCGCLEVERTGLIVTTLWKEHNCYHIRTHSSVEGRLNWQSVPLLTDARLIKRQHVLRYH